MSSPVTGPPLARGRACAPAQGRERDEVVVFIAQAVAAAALVVRVSVVKHMAHGGKLGRCVELRALDLVGNVQNCKKCLNMNLLCPRETQCGVRERGYRLSLEGLKGMIEKHTRRKDLFSEE